MIRVYDEAGNVIETHEHAGDFRASWRFGFALDETCAFYLAVKAVATVQLYEKTFYIKYISGGRVQEKSFREGEQVSLP